MSQQLLARTGLAIIAVSVAGLVQRLPAPAAEPAGTPAAAGPSAAHLVDQLGDPSFRARQQAARQLTQMGAAARAALRQGTRHHDLEVRMGARRLLMQITQSDFEARLAAFLELGGSQLGKQLSGWQAFAELVGNERAARELFVEMLRAEQPLLDALAGKPDAEPLGPLLLRRIEQCQQSRFPNGMPGGYSAASLAAVVFVGSQKEMAADLSATSRVFALLNSRPSKGIIQHGKHSDLLLKLLGNWVDRQNQPTASYYALRVALAYSLKEPGARLGRDLLQSADALPHMAPYAGIALARFGNTNDIPLLIQHLDNTKVCHTWSNTQIQAEPIRIQVRDVILACLIHLAGQQPKDYGYQLLKRDPETLYHIYTFGFLGDAQRDKALAKWRKWYAEHKDKLTAWADKD